MSKRVSFVAVALSLVAPFSSVAAAQSIDDATVAKIRNRVAAGDHVSVTDGNRRTVSGVLSNVSDTLIQVATAEGPVEIPMLEVAEVKQRGDRRWDAALFGAAIGGVLGYSTGGGGCGAQEFLCLDFRGPAAAAGALVGGGIALVADLLHEGSHTVYRAKRIVRRVDVNLSPAGAQVRVALRF